MPAERYVIALLRPPPPFVAVGLGVLTVVLVHNPRAAIPSPPYWPWLMLAAAVGALGMLCQLGLVDAFDDFDDIEEFVDRAMRRRAAGVSYLVGVVAAATYLGMVALLDRLDRLF